MAFQFRELFWDVFREDLRAWERNGWSRPNARRVETFAMAVRHNGLRATFLARLAHYGTVKRVPLLPSVLSQLNIALHGIELPPNVPIGPGLYMPHTVGTVINAERIGSNVTLQGGITIGLRTETAFPVIGDGVFLAAGCRVLGPVSVGDGATVGANAVVVRDVPAGAVAVGVPARATMPGRARHSADAGETPVSAASRN